MIAIISSSIHTRRREFGGWLEVSLASAAAATWFSWCGRWVPFGSAERRRVWFRGGLFSDADRVDPGQGRGGAGRQPASCFRVV